MKLVAAFTTSILLYCSAIFASPATGSVEFAGFANSLVNQAALRGTSWSILVHSLNGDSTVYQWDPDRRLIPASVAKIVTSAVALDALGAGFRFETVVSSTGPIDTEGRLRGNLEVHGSGDPMFSPTPASGMRTPPLNAWADSLRRLGVRGIEGDLILRTWPFRLQVSSSDWEVGDVNDRFGPPTDGFGFNSNVCQVAIRPGPAVGAGASFTVTPAYAPVEIRSSVVTRPNGTEPLISFRLVPEDSVVYISGEIPLGDDGEFLWIAVQSPALYFGRALQAVLSSRGINISGKIVVERGAPAAAGTVLFTHRSPPLSEMVKLMNKDSDNLVSEYVLRAVGARVNKSGDLRSGLNAGSRFLRGLGIDDTGIYLRDGSGLARQNLCSARGIVELLKSMYMHPASEAYLNSMAVSGIDGTISFRMSTPQMRGKVRAKTGTINHVSNLAGYLIGDNGNIFMFAILCNNFPAGRRQNIRAAQDAILERLYTISAHNFSTTDR